MSKHPESKNETADKELGFILSYPVNQGVLSQGTAIKWKSFSADDIVEFTYICSILGMLLLGNLWNSSLTW